MILAAWLILIVCEAVVALRTRSTAFRAFAGYGCLRSAFVLAWWLLATRDPAGYAAGYAWAWATTEPIDMILLCAIGVDLVSRAVGSPAPRSAYAALPLMVAAFGAGIGIPPVLCHTSWIMRTCARLEAMRSFAAFCVFGSLVVAHSWQQRWPSRESLIAIVFAWADVTCYLLFSINPAWAKMHSEEMTKFVMLAQAGCWLAWTLPWQRMSLKGIYEPVYR